MVFRERRLRDSRGKPGKDSKRINLIDIRTKVTNGSN